MSLLFIIFIAAALAGLAFVMLPAAGMASFLRLLLPSFLIAIGFVTASLGRPMIGSLTIVAGFVLWQFLRKRAKGREKQEEISSRTIRSAAFEMETNHSGEVSNGIVLAGRFEGRVLDDMARADLLRLRSEIESDDESLELLDAYLDGRFPDWREDTHLDGGAG